MVCSFQVLNQQPSGYQSIPVAVIEEEKQILHIWRKKKRDLRPLYEEPVSAIVFVNCESRRKERWLAGL